MKLKYILAAGVVALLAGCDESRFLDTKPQGTLNDDLLSSAEGVELLVTSAYAGLKGPNRDMHWVPMTNWTHRLQAVPVGMGRTCIGNHTVGIR